MKQLTQEEFDALPNNRPLDVNVDGVPPDLSEVLVWHADSNELPVWETASVFGDNWWLEHDLPLIETRPIYHKLPPDYIDPEREERAIPRTCGGW